MQDKFTRNRSQKSTYNCVCCDRKTRETGYGESGSESCAFCFEAAGIENGLSDGAITSEEAKVQFAALVKQFGKRSHVDCLNFSAHEEEEKPVVETRQQAKARRAKARRAAARKS